MVGTVKNFLAPPLWSFRSRALCQGERGVADCHLHLGKADRARQGPATGEVSAPAGRLNDDSARSRRLRASVLSMLIVSIAGARALADSLADARIAKCQTLVGREVAGARVVAGSWKTWDHPVPKPALTAAALSHIRAHDLLYNGGIGGTVLRPYPLVPGGPRQVFAFCSYDNMFVWLQGVDNGGHWTAFDPAEDALPY